LLFSGSFPPDFSPTDLSCRTFRLPWSGHQPTDLPLRRRAPPKIRLGSTRAETGPRRWPHGRCSTARARTGWSPWDRSPGTASRRPCRRRLRALRRRAGRRPLRRGSRHQPARRALNPDDPFAARERNTLLGLLPSPGGYQRHDRIGHRPQALAGGSGFLLPRGVTCVERLVRARRAPTWSRLNRSSTSC
jgi:hypothetical protein